MRILDVSWCDMSWRHVVMSDISLPMYCYTFFIDVCIVAFLWLCLIDCILFDCVHCGAL